MMKTMRIPRAIRPRGGGVLPYMSYIGMCRPGIRPRLLRGDRLAGFVF